MAHGVYMTMMELHVLPVNDETVECRRSLATNHSKSIHVYVMT